MHSVRKCQIIGTYGSVYFKKEKLCCKYHNKPSKGIINITITADVLRRLYPINKSIFQGPWKLTYSSSRPQRQARLWRTVHARPGSSS